MSSAIFEICDSKHENLFNLNPEERNLEIYLKNPKNIEKTKLNLQNIFEDYYVYTWSDLNKSLFSAFTENKSKDIKMIVL